MTTHYVLTVSSDDKPGIVRQIADTVTRHNGNWLESRLAQLAGKFVGVIHITVAADHAADLQVALKQLQADAILVTIEPFGTSSASPPGRTANFTATGPDRSGIVREISRAFSQRSINVVELSSECSSMPYSGEPMFTVAGLISLPDPVDIDDLTNDLDAIADSLGIDIQCDA